MIYIYEQLGDLHESMNERLRSINDELVFGDITPERRSELNDEVRRIKSWMESVDKLRDFVYDINLDY